MRLKFPHLPHLTCTVLLLGTVCAAVCCCDVSDGDGMERNEIIVENDGVDFESADDNEPHIALKNIQNRLEMMCRGKMTITPRKGGGTVVKVTIPDA